MNLTYTPRKTKMLKKFDFNDSEVHGFYKENENIILNLKYVKDSNLLFFHGA